MVDLHGEESSSFLVIVSITLFSYSKTSSSILILSKNIHKNFMLHCHIDKVTEAAWMQLPNGWRFRAPLFQWTSWPCPAAKDLCSIRQPEGQAGHRTTQWNVQLSTCQNHYIPLPSSAYSLPFQRYYHSRLYNSQGIFKLDGHNSIDYASPI